jgi:ATP-binding cassette subfamily B protein
MDAGTHDELLERGGIYADLYRLQFEGGKTVVDFTGTPELNSDRDDALTDKRPGLVARIRSRFFG